MYSSGWHHLISGNSIKMKDPAKIKHEIKWEQHTSHEILSSMLHEPPSNASKALNIVMGISITPHRWRFEALFSFFDVYNLRLFIEENQRVRNINTVLKKQSSRAALTQLVGIKLCKWSCFIFAKKIQSPPSRHLKTTCLHAPARTRGSFIVFTCSWSISKYKLEALRAVPAALREWPQSNLNYSHIPVNGALTKDTSKKIDRRWIEISDRHPPCSIFWRVNLYLITIF